MRSFLTALLCVFYAGAAVAGSAGQELGGSADISGTSDTEVLLNSSGSIGSDSSLTYDGTTLGVTRILQDDIDGSNGRVFTDNDTIGYSCSVSGDDVAIFTSSFDLTPKVAYLCNTDGSWEIPTLAADSSLLTSGGAANAVVTSATLLGKVSGSVATFQGVSDGEFEVTINAESQDVSGLDFTAGISDEDDIAAKIQVALRATSASAGFASATVTHDGVSRYLITTGATDDTAAILAVTDPSLGGTYIGDTSYLKMGVTSAGINNGRLAGENWAANEDELSGQAFVINGVDVVGGDGDRHDTMKLQGQIQCDGTGSCGTWASDFKIRGIMADKATWNTRISAAHDGPVTLFPGEGDTDVLVMNNGTYTLTTDMDLLDASRTRSEPNENGTYVTTGTTQCETVHFGGFSGSETSPVMIPGHALTLTRVHAFCEDVGSGDATFDISQCDCVNLYDTGGPPQTSGNPDNFCDDDGSTTIAAARLEKARCTETIATISACDADSTLDEDLSLANTSIAVDQMVWLNVTAVGAGGTDNAIVTLCYTR